MCVEKEFQSSRLSIEIGLLRIQEHPSKEVRARAGKVFTNRVDPDRNKIVLAYEPALKLKGDAGRGLALFTKHCATCHRLGTVGQEVGP